MTTLFNKTSDYIMKDIPVEDKQFDTIVLSYGCVLNKNEIKTIKVPIEYIKELVPSSNGYNKIKVIWNSDIDDYYEINYGDMFNSVKFE